MIHLSFGDIETREIKTMIYRNDLANTASRYIRTKHSR